MAVTVTHSKTLVAPSTGVEDKVYGADYVSPTSHTVVVDNATITYAQIQNVTGERLLGRASAIAGVIQEITLGSNLSFTGTTLNATGGGGLVVGTTPITLGAGGRILFEDSANILQEDAGLTYDVGAATLEAPNAYVPNSVAIGTHASIDPLINLWIFYQTDGDGGDITPAEIDVQIDDPDTVGVVRALQINVDNRSTNNVGDIHALTLRAHNNGGGFVSKIAALTIEVDPTEAGTGHTFAINAPAGEVVLTGPVTTALDPALVGDGTYTGSTITGTLGETVAFGQMVYLKAADSKWWKANATVTATGGGVACACCVEAGDADDVRRLLLDGNVRADSLFPALTVGASVYLSTTAGAVQTTAPSTTGNIVRIVGHALTADSMLFRADHTYTGGGGSSAMTQGKVVAIAAGWPLP